MKNLPISKTIQKEETYFVQFSPEEMETLGIKTHDKFEVSSTENGEILLQKFAKLDIDLEEFDKSTLIGLIQKSIEEQVPVDEIIRKILTSYLTLDNK
jgi:hypothetical protein